MLMLTRRLQVLLDDDRYERLESEAQRRQVAVAVIVREAIDARYGVTAEARRAAGEAILAAERMEVPPVGELLAELDEIRSRRL